MEAGARRGNGGAGDRPAQTLMVQATMDEGKSKVTEVKVACQERKVKKVRVRKKYFG